ncbi:hypothetical protein [Accumulibacter sp.]|uniref:hypothetical protein n=1 Tax=Accumulibacter sp. TaxID=2053492 RepID=UPI002BD6A8F1|nr:hypothetical protein [Accumulibacter sp.]HMW64260.1 hypothetical protein [Accumulibacter sp.]HNE40767.1 hypothetical protein [Accumulibacter sp.]
MMDRREFLMGLGAGVASLSLPAIASPAPSCTIIGIGAAGCNLGIALGKQCSGQAGAVLSYACVDLGPHALESVDLANDANPDLPQIKMRRDADLVMAFSNKEWINRFSGDASLIDIWDELDRHIASNLHSVVAPLCTPDEPRRFHFRFRPP